MVGILYESDEWSDWKLASELEARGMRVRMIDMRKDDCLEQASDCSLLVSRVFASAAFRGHEKSHALMRDMIELAKRSRTPMVNAPESFDFEISKLKSAQALESARITVPKVQAIGLPSDLAKQPDTWAYPCVIKPDCGGRTTYTMVLEDADEARSFLRDAPDIDFIVEDFIESSIGALTRVEVVDGKAALIVKRSVAENGLSSYHMGSRYELYTDCPQKVIDSVLDAAKLTGITFGSFDVIEAKDGKDYIIDVNAVSNVSEDCTEIFGMDLMAVYAEALAKKGEADAFDQGCL